MSAKKRTPDTPAATGSPTARRLAIAGILLLMVGGVSLAVWRHVSDHVLSASHYQVQPEQVRLSPAPPWIHGNPPDETGEFRIATEVLRDVTRQRPLSLLDNDLTVRLAEAFAAHPWIERVERVSKHFPSGVEVTVAYRTPVAMVEVHDGQGVLPVDEHAVLLPTRDFSVEEAEQYPRIGEIFSNPPDVVGRRWGDAAVLGGAQIAAAVGSDWKRLDLARIVPIERKPARSGFEYTYRLYTHSGTTVDWGRAPGTDLPGEIPAGDKLAQLKRYHQQNGGTLDGQQGPHGIVIDQHGALLRKENPQVAPLPPVNESRVRAASERREFEYEGLEEPPD